jgi:RNA polymerase sigma factor (TIGR02999 family)
LQQWRLGDRDAEARLFELVEPDLRRAAQYVFSGERRGRTLQPTALLNETYIKLHGAREIDWRNRGHFFAVAARAMRRYLIDYARTHKKPPSVPPDLLPELAASLPAGNLELAIEIDRLLEELNAMDPEFCSVVDIKYFYLTRDQHQKRWMRARAWLFERVGGPGCKEKASGTSGS